MKAPELQSERLVYRPLSLAHLGEAYVGWMNDPEVFRYLETGGSYTLDMLREYLKDAEEKNILFWAIHIKDNDKHIGNIKIDPINKRHGYGEYGIMMGDREEWSKGYAREASKTIVDYCFNETGLRKINLGVVEDNVAGVMLYKKLGFVVEGLYKDHGYYGGKLCNVVRMAIFNPQTQK